MRCCWVFSFVLVLVFINCSLDEPQMPSWNTTLNFPVVEKNYNLKELIDENDELINYDDGQVGLRVAGDLDKIKVEKNLRLDDIEKSRDLTVSEVEIAEMSVGQLVFEPTNVIPDAATSFSEPRIVDRFEFPPFGASFSPDDGIVSATVSSAILRLDFENHLPVSVEITEFNLKENDENGAVKLHYATPLIIAPKSTARLDIEVRNMDIVSGDYWSVSGNCLGSNGQDVIVNQEDTFDIQVSLVNLTAEELAAPADYFTVDKTDTVQIGEAVCIRRASFCEGSITLDVANRLPFGLNLSITSPQFVNKITGLPLTIEAFVQANSSKSKSLSITDYTIEYAGELEKPQCVDLYVHAKGDENSGQISVNSSDNVSFTFAMRDVVIDEFTGLLDQFMVGIKPIEQKVDMPSSISQISGLYLDDPRLSIDFFNTLEMPIHLEGALKGTASDGKQQTLDIKTDIDRGTLEAETKSSVEFDDSQAKQVKLFASLMPETIAFSGSTFVGKGLAEGSILSESYIRARYELETPACFSWNATEFTPDTTYFQINPKGYNGGKLRDDAKMLDADDMEMLEDFHVNGTIDNHLPISGSVEFYLVTQLPDGTEEVQTLNPVKIQSAQTDEAGLVSDSWQGKLNVELGVGKVHVLQNAEDQPKLVALVTTMMLDGSGGGKVKVYETDYLNVKVVAELLVGINKE